MCAISTILIAEDDDHDFFFIERALRKTAYEGEIVRALDGSQTIETLHSLCIDRLSLPALGLIDLKMPRCDGFGVLAWRQKHCELSCIPLIVLSSSRMQSDVKRAYDLGACSFTMKPMAANDYLDLCTALQHWWEHCEFAEDRDASQVTSSRPHRNRSPAWPWFVTPEMAHRPVTPPRATGKVSARGLVNGCA